MDRLAILLVEDNPADVRLIHDGLTSAGIACTVHVVPDGSRALEYLRSCHGGGHSEGPLVPDLIVLDLHLPIMDGHETLVYLKQDPQLRRIPVVVVSGGDNQDEIWMAYREYANCVVVKPLDAHGLSEVGESIATFWSSVVKFARI